MYIFILNICLALVYSGENTARTFLIQILINQNCPFRVAVPAPPGSIGVSQKTLAAVPRQASCSWYLGTLQWGPAWCIVWWVSGLVGKSLMVSLVSPERRHILWIEVWEDCNWLNTGNSRCWPEIWIWNRNSSRLNVAAKSTFETFISYYTLQCFIAPSKQL